MLELLNQLDGFDSRGDVKVIMATNRIETLDPALIRPGQSERRLTHLQEAFRITPGHFPHLISHAVISHPVNLSLLTHFKVTSLFT